MPIAKSHLSRRVPLIAALAALALCLCAPQALARYVYTGNHEAGTVSVIDTATNQTVGSPIPLPVEAQDPTSMAITPDGRTLYVANFSGDEDVTVIDTQSNQRVGPISISPTFQVGTIAVSPDGKTVYATDQGPAGNIAVIDTATNQVVDPPIALGPAPYGLAFSPDGKSAYVTNYEDESVSVIDTQTRQVVGPPIPVGGRPINVVISPDGKTAYVNNQEDDSISVIDTASRQVVGTPITVGEEPWALALTPDGSRLYVSNEGEDTVSVIDTASRQVIGPSIAVGDLPYELAATPDGKAVYVTNFGSGPAGSVSVIDTQSNQVSTTIPVAGGPWQLAIAPNQSPTASFSAGMTFSRPVEAVFFGNHSSDPDGSVTRFDWSFGDGLTAPNGGPITMHKYANTGTYSASLTVTDNEGCSVNMVFTGRTAHCSGSSLATEVRSLQYQRESLAFKAPNNFKFGKLKRNLRKGTAKLKIRVPAAGKLILTGKKVRRVQRSAKKASTMTLNIRPKRKVKKLLARKGSVKVRVKVAFLPTGGDKRTKSKTLKLIQR